MDRPKRFVYVIRSSAVASHYYTGSTSEVTARLASHNNGECQTTAKYKPWKLDVASEFSDERRALAFERYLKSGSGIVLANDTCDE
jgi:predicted GIY-YIG superfamily endonuclease